MEKQSPLLRVWSWGKEEHRRLTGAILSAFAGVVFGMLPYFAVAEIIIRMLAGEKELSGYLPWLCAGLAGYAARTLLYNLALASSHKATFSILKTIRQKILKKLPKLPLGTVIDLPVCTGLAHGAFVSCDDPGGMRVYDVGHGKLPEGL